MSNIEYDVVVIGAGNGGLAAATTASQKGLKTLMIEQHNLPGGFASSFVRGRFEFEPSLHELCDLGSKENPGGVRKFFDSLGLDIDWSPVPDAYRLIVTNSGEELDLRMPFGPDAYINELEKLVPDSRPAMTKFMELCKEVTEAFAYLGESKGNPDKKVLTSTYSNFLKTCPYTVDQVQKSIKLPKKACDIVNAYWCYLGFEVERLNITIFAAMFYKYMEHGAWIPKLRSHEISTAFDVKFREFGGTVLYNHKVDKILVENGEVAGVVTDNGKTYKTKNVISNASPHLVYGKMIDEDKLPEMATKEANARLIGPRGYVAYFGLNKSVEELGITDYTYFIFPTANSKKLYDSMNDINANPIQAVACVNIVNPDASPKGTCMLTITTLYGENAWDEVNAENYFKTKNAIASRMIDYFEQSTGIKIREFIEEVEIATPATFARYTGAYQGAIYGYQTEPWDSIMPRMSMMAQDTRIKGLRFCGGNAFRAYGYGGSYMSGNTVALQTYVAVKEAK